jgi:thiazole synthase
MPEIELNGAPHTVPAGASLHALVGALGLQGQALALAVNRAWCRASAGPTRSCSRPTGSTWCAPSAAADSSFQNAENDMTNTMQEDRPLTHRRQTLPNRACWSAAASTATSSRPRAATEAAGAEIVTVAIRRVNIGQDAGPKPAGRAAARRYTILPNTAGCYTAKDAVYTLQLARELLNDHKLVKLEVLGDEKTLFPNMPETLRAAGELVRDGFDVMVYCSDDPIQARMLEDIGCVAVMPLASLIGSGMGILNPWNLSLIIEQARVPVLVDAGVGTASDAAIAMELGCDGVLMNSAIALARDPVRMARAMRLAVEAGREAYLAGRMARRFARRPRRRWRGGCDGRASLPGPACWCSPDSIRPAAPASRPTSRRSAPRARMRCRW